MLVELSVRGWGLIEEAQVALKPGMTAFTGETGAGKSLLVGAIAFSLGEKVPGARVRAGAEKAEVVAVWQPKHPELAELLDEAGIQWAPGEELIVRRVLEASGRTQAWVQGVRAPVALLKRIGERLASLHGQHAHQALMRPSFAREVLDARVDPELAAQVERAYAAWRQTQERLEAFRTRKETLAARLEELRAAVEEARACGIEPGVLEALQQEVARGRKRAALLETAQRVAALCQDGEINARGLLAEALAALRQVHGLHPALDEAEGLLEEADALLSEAAARAADLLTEPWDEAGFQEAEARLDRIRRLMRRHGLEDEQALLQALEAWQAELEAWDLAGWDEAALVRELEKARARFLEAAEALDRARQEEAARLAEALGPQLAALGMPHAEVAWRFAPLDESAWGAHGISSVELAVRTNPGEPMLRVDQVASGGELSRIALALRAVGAEASDAEVAVFDEADVGVGGETAWAVGRLLREMSGARQVLVVSHLPQVAASADHQVRIEKRVQGGRAVVELVPLADEEARVEELARMLGDRTALDAARALLRRGRAG